MQRPFSMIPLPARNAEKPRSRGLTMMMDWGLPLEQQRAWMKLQAPYVDLAKIVVGTARLYEEGYLLEKLALYDEYNVRPFIGGQFLEYVIHAQGMQGAGAFFAEACRLGFKAIEVSDNVVPLNDNERRSLIAQAVEYGLEVHGEVGSKSDNSSADDLVRQATDCFEAGADVVLVEGAELLLDGEPNAELIAGLKDGLDLDRVIFELAGPWIKGVTHTDNYQLKVFLIRTFGPDVNLANIMPDMIWETEASRLGLSTSGPLPAG